MRQHLHLLIVLRHPKPTDSERSQVGAYRGSRCLLRSAFDCRRRADGTRARRRRRALGRRRALDIGATRTRARRALTTLLRAGTAINDDRLRLRDTALKHILT